ncbi:MAG: hypothetical protein M3N68_06195 [Actinomycetota bacterium]|nr:hypothetical protein [Actinomycetota bacterium]
MTYFVSPSQETEWQLAPSELAERLSRQWPDAVIRPVENQASNHSLEWTMTIDRWRVDGSLDKTGQTVHLDGDIDACAHLARWLREQVPPQQELVFYDEAFSADVALLPTTTEEDLVAPFIR